MISICHIEVIEKNIIFELNNFTVPGAGNQNKKQNKTWISA
jgi:hypothetical protein